MLKGTLDDFTLADVFKLLSFSKKTGRLEMTRKAGMGRVFFQDGDVYFAESSLAREPLGQKLIRSHSLTETHLRQALDENAESGERVGQILLREGWITAEQLEDAVKQQIEDAVFDLLRWERGDFDWEPNATIEPEVPISVSVENLIMEASRRLDELEVIAKKVPSRDAIVTVAPAPPEGAVEINITPDEWRVLVLVDGTRSVEEIANTIGLDEFHTMKIVHGMVSAGLIEVVGAEEMVSDVAPAPAVPDHAPPPPPPAPLEASTPVDTFDVADQNGTGVLSEPSFGDFDQPRETFEEPAEAALGTPVSFEEPTPSDFEEPLGIEPAGPVESEFVTEPEAAGEGQGVEEQELIEAGEDPFATGELEEETLFEAGAPAETAPEGPPEEWFADPDLHADVFDAPEPGELVAEMPEAAEPEAIQDQQTADMESELISDDSLREAQAPADEEAPAERRAPAGPPIEPLEGADRTVAVRELSGLFEDVVERPKPPVIRKLDPAAEGILKRRVEDDEQVTKGLISRLIEGVKGL